MQSFWRLEKTYSWWQQRQSRKIKMFLLIIKYDKCFVGLQPSFPSHFWNQVKTYICNTDSVLSLWPLRSIMKLENNKFKFKLTWTETYCVLECGPIYHPTRQTPCMPRSRCGGWAPRSGWDNIRVIVWLRAAEWRRKRGSECPRATERSGSCPACASVGTLGRERQRGRDAGVQLERRRYCGWPSGWDNVTVPVTVMLLVCEYPTRNPSLLHTYFFYMSASQTPARYCTLAYHDTPDLHLPLSTLPPSSLRSPPPLLPPPSYLSPCHSFASVHVLCPCSTLQKPFILSQPH